MKKRVKIPVGNPTQLFALATRIKDKHIEDGNASILTSLEWEKIISSIEKKNH